MPTSYLTGSVVTDGTEQSLTGTISDDGDFEARLDLVNATALDVILVLRAKVRVQAGGAIQNIEVGTFTGDGPVNVNTSKISNVQLIEFTVEQTQGTTGITVPWEIIRTISNQSILDAVNAIGSGTGGALNFEAIADNASTPIEGVSSVGTETGTFANTEAEDGTYHQITHDTDVIDWIYEFNVGGERTATKVVFNGYLMGANDQINMQAFDDVGSDWETIAVIDGQALAGNITVDPILLLKHTGGDSNLGRVLIRFVTPGGQTNPDLFVDQLIVEALTTSISTGYEFGAVWIDTVDGTAGAEPGVNGTADKPCLTLGDADTVAAAIGLKRFQVVANSVIQFVSARESEVWDGNNWDLDFNGQSISNTVILGANIIGTATAAERPRIGRSSIGAATLPPALLADCGFTGTWIVGNSGNFDLLNCASLVPGAAIPIIDFNSVGNTSLNVKDWSGGLTVTGFTSTDDVVLEGIGGTIDVQGDGGVSNFKVRGIYEKVVDNTTTGTSTRVTALVNQTVIQDASAAVERNTSIPEGFPFEMISSTDNVSPVLGATVTVERSLDGGAYAAVAGSVSEVGEGSYVFIVAPADCDCRWGKWRFTAAGALDTKIGFRTFV